VVEYSRHNDEIASYGLGQKATLAARTVWAWDSFREIKALLERERPDVAHFHNTFPLISPAAYYACREAGVPVVQTLQNYRLLCPGATLMREGRVCEDCLGKVLPWRGIAHGCYRGSRTESAAVALLLGVHNALRTWANRVDVFIAVTAFARRKFIGGGLPAEKIIVKPNLVHPDPWGPDRRSTGAKRKSEGEKNALFVGRLSAEKGLRTLVAAWQRLDVHVPLRIVGGGPLRPELEGLVNGSRTIRFDGYMTRDQVLAALEGANFLVLPSEWYETFGLVAVEAFACGVPVIASRLGAMEEIVEDGKTGLHFTPGDPENLAAKVEWAWTHPREMEEMGRQARAEYEAKYTSQRNYELLMETYRGAIQAARERNQLC
jgi:glycosyltransferase involved in cell wall biosynthesis